MATEPVLEVKDCNAFYGQAHVLQDVAFTVGDEPVAIIGRNGMGKTTLCKAIVGMSPPVARGSIRFRGEELVHDWRFATVREVWTGSDPEAAAMIWITWLAPISAGNTRPSDTR